MTSLFWYTKNLNPCRGGVLEKLMKMHRMRKTAWISIFLCVKVNLLFHVIFHELVEVPRGVFFFELEQKLVKILGRDLSPQNSVVCRLCCLCGMVPGSGNMKTNLLAMPRSRERQVSMRYQCSSVFSHPQFLVTPIAPDLHHSLHDFLRNFSSSPSPLGSEDLELFESRGMC